MGHSITAFSEALILKTIVDEDLYIQQLVSNLALKHYISILLLQYCPLERGPSSARSLQIVHDQHFVTVRSPHDEPHALVLMQGPHEIHGALEDELLEHHAPPVQVEHLPATPIQPPTKNQERPPSAPSQPTRASSSNTSRNVVRGRTAPNHVFITMPHQQIIEVRRAWIGRGG